jgi:hypothetical protein
MGDLGAMQETLQEAGIESRIVAPQDNVYDTRYLQLQIAERDAIRAEAILAQPSKLEHKQNEVEEDLQDWALPTCTRCGASDPLLESVEPSNTWLCEVCGARWTEAAEDLEERSGSR